MELSCWETSRQTHKRTRLKIISPLNKNERTYPQCRDTVTQSMAVWQKPTSLTQQMRTINRFQSLLYRHCCLRYRHFRPTAAGKHGYVGPTPWQPCMRLIGYLRCSNCRPPWVTVHNPEPLWTSATVTSLEVVANY